jgi:hypothetical protein
MSLHDSSYTIEWQSDECEIIHVSTTNSSSVVNLSSSLTANSPSATNEFTIIEIYNNRKDDNCTKKLLFKTTFD